MKCRPSRRCVHVASARCRRRGHHCVAVALTSHHHRVVRTRERGKVHPSCVVIVVVASRKVGEDERHRGRKSKERPQHGSVTPADSTRVPYLAPRISTIVPTLLQMPGAMQMSETPQLQ